MNFSGRLLRLWSTTDQWPSAGTRSVIVKSQLSFHHHNRSWTEQVFFIGAGCTYQDLNSATGPQMNLISHRKTY